MAWKERTVPWDALADTSCPAPPLTGGGCPPSTWLVSSLHDGWRCAHCTDAELKELGASRAGTPLHVLQSWNPAACPPGRSGVLPRSRVTPPAPRTVQTFSRRGLLLPARHLCPLPSAAPAGRGCFSSAPQGCADFLTPGSAPARPPSLLAPQLLAQPGAAAFPPALAPCALWLGRPPTPSSCGVLPESSF